MSVVRGKTILITGAAKRIGHALAIELAKQGANIIIHYNTSEGEAKTLFDDIRNLGVEVYLTKADLTKPRESSELIQKAMETAGVIDALINSASVFSAKKFWDVTIDDLNIDMLVNAWAPFILSREFAQKLGRGKIVNFLDTRIAGYDFDRFSYYLSKKMLETLTMSLALEFAPNITVNAVAPGLILPPEGKDRGYLEKLEKTVPLKRHGAVSDVVSSAIFLLLSDFVTGQVIYVDGGKHLLQTFEGLSS